VKVNDTQQMEAPHIFFVPCDTLSPSLSPSLTLSHTDTCVSVTPARDDGEFQYEFFSSSHSAQKNVCGAEVKRRRQGGGGGEPARRRRMQRGGARKIVAVEWKPCQISR